MKIEIDRLLSDPDQSINLRLFIFDEQIKNIFLYRNLPLLKAIQGILEAIYSL